MTQSNPAPNLTFFLPVLIIVVLEMCKVARDIDLRKLIEEGHKPLLLTPIFSSPFLLTRAFILYTYSSLNLSIKINEHIYGRLSHESYSRTVHLIENEMDQEVAGENNAEKLITIYNNRDQYPLTRKTRLSLYLDYYLLFVHNYDNIAVERVQSISFSVIRHISRFESKFVPNLGRFMFIHSANSAVLLSSLYLSIIYLSGNFRDITVAIIVLIWLLLPVFEVTEYDDVMPSGARIASIPFHLVATLVFSAYIYFINQGEYLELLLSIPIVWPVPSTSSLNSIAPIPVLRIVHVGIKAVHAWTVFLLFSIWVYSFLLENELKKSASSKS